MNCNNSNNLVVPLGFCRVHDNIYRSSYPSTKSLPFISTLGLKSMICLTPSDIKKELRDYCEKVFIFHHHHQHHHHHHHQQQQQQHYHRHHQHQQQHYYHHPNTNTVV